MREEPGCKNGGYDGLVSFTEPVFLPERLGKEKKKVKRERKK